MAKSKYSPTFPPDITPVHEGWYETTLTLPFKGRRNWWNGKTFSVGVTVSATSDLVTEQRRKTEFFPVGWVYWRGLAEKPKKENPPGKKRR